MTDEKPYSHPPLTAQDRCDRCAATALIRLMTLKGDLLFCGHHYDRHGRAAAQKGAVIIQDIRGAGPRLHGDKIPVIGRMWLQGLTSRDTCRWCATRLTFLRRKVGRTHRNFFTCDVCDNTAADFDDWLPPGDDPIPA